MIVSAKITGFDGEILTLTPSVPIENELLRKSIHDVELRLNDGRTISNDQRKKIFATIRDIALWSGHDPEEIRQYLTWDFRSIDGRPAFSLSDCDMTTAREFLSYLIEFCFMHNIPTRDTLLNRSDDIDKYLYLCLLHRKCAVCNKPAEVHHIDRIGMGRDREKIVHTGLLAAALCSKHHSIAHNNEKSFFEKHHIYGIRLDEILCRELNLNTKER